MSLVYGDKFKGNTKLYKSQFVLLFSRNDKLISAKNLILSATELSEKCYSSMFKNCSALNECPDLPATILATECYRDMFNGCTSITESPVLPAEKLVDGCYYSMFEGCRSLKQITMLANNNKAIRCLFHFTLGVASNGIFIIAKDADITIDNYRIEGCGIPNKWDIKEI